jgi:hypothetical protein
VQAGQLVERVQIGAGASANSSAGKKRAPVDLAVEGGGASGLRLQLPDFGLRRLR